MLKKKENNNNNREIVFFFSKVFKPVSDSIVIRKNYILSSDITRKYFEDIFCGVPCWEGPPGLVVIAPGAVIPLIIGETWGPWFACLRLFSQTMEKFISIIGMFNAYELHSMVQMFLTLSCAIIQVIRKYHNFFFFVTFCQGIAWLMAHPAWWLESSPLHCKSLNTLYNKIHLLTKSK